MKTKTIEIGVDVAKNLIPFLEEKLARARDTQHQAAAEVNDLTMQLAEVKSKLNGNLSVEKTPRGRMPKGAGEKAIIGLLSGIGVGRGFTMADISEKSGVKPSSVYRFLKIKNKGRFVELDGYWKLAPT